MSTITYHFTFSYPETSLAVTEVNNEAPGQKLQSTLFILDLIDKKQLKVWADAFAIITGILVGRFIIRNENEVFWLKDYYYGTRIGQPS